MMRPLAIVLLGTALVLPAYAIGTVLAAPAVAAETALTLTVDGRPVSRSRSVVLVRHGVPYVDLVEAVRVFNGLVTFGHGTVSASIGNRVAVFTRHRASVTVDGNPLDMVGSTFIYRADLYVPLAFFVEKVLTGATLQVDSAAGRAQISLGGNAESPSQSPSPSARPSPRGA